MARIADLDRAIEIKPDYSWALTSRGEIYRHKGDYDRAIVDLDKAIGIDPKYAWTWVVRGEAYRQKGDYDRAIADLSEALKIDPEYTYAYSSRGEAYRQKGDFERAIPDLSEAIRRNPKYTFALSNRGEAYRESGRYDLAIADLNAALELSPRYRRALVSRGRVHLEQKDYDLAIRDFNEAISEDPGPMATFMYRGEAYRRQGILDFALADIERAIEIDATNAEAYAIKGYIHHAMGETGAADRDFAKARELDPQIAIEPIASTPVTDVTEEVAEAPAPAETSAAEVESSDSSLSTDSVEVAFWNTVKDSDDPSMLRAYLDRFPSGHFAALARIKLLKLQPEPAQKLKTATDLLHRILPAVVKIQFKQAPDETVPIDPETLENAKGTPFEDFFEQFFDETNNASIITQSGFIASRDGHIVTTHYAMNPAHDIQVILSDDSRLDAKLIGADAGFALLKVDREQAFPFVDLATRNVVSGEQLLVIGAPAGLDRSVRLTQVVGWNETERFARIVLDLPLFAEDAGAPIFDWNGQMVGIADLDGANQESARSPAKAVPATIAKEVISQLIKNGEVSDDTAFSHAVNKVRELSAPPFSQLSTDIDPIVAQGAKAALVSVIVYSERTPAGSEGNSGTGNSDDNLRPSYMHGVLISAEGHVMTPSHHVEGAKKFTVRRSNGQNFEAELIGNDDRTGIALLKITRNEAFPFAEFSEETVQRGEVVFSFGGRNVVRSFVQTGLVSNLNRAIGTGPYNYLQTDLRFKKGEGGPIFNLEGELVGLGTSMYLENGQSVGISYGVPAIVAEPVIAELKKSGRVSRGWLGVSIQDVPENLIGDLGLSNARGTLVTAIAPDGPGSKADLKVRDVILSVDGRDVKNSRQFARMIADLPANSNTALALVRDGENKTITVTLGTFTPPQEVLEENKTQVDRSTADVLQDWMTLSPVKSETGSDGVLVTAVQSGSEAAEKGLKVGDVIFEVGGKPVSQPSEVTQHFAEEIGEGRKAVLLHVRTGNEARFVALSIANE
jgi:serine protease Do